MLVEITNEPDAIFETGLTASGIDFHVCGGVNDIARNVVGPSSVAIVVICLGRISQLLAPIPAGAGSSVGPDIMGIGEVIRGCLRLGVTSCGDYQPSDVIVVIVT